ncbi:MAG: NAD-dependent epimerase/dehydratase family protein [Christensenellales bacterium]|jgi:nucleoside-diphosphate-sugar epimerase
MKRILITGKNSYIGTSVEKYLAQWPDQYQVDTIDMIDGSWREKSFVSYDSVFHVAGIAHISTKKFNEEQKRNYWAVNAKLPVEVAIKAKHEGVKQYIFLSSVSVYGHEGCLRNSFVISKNTPLNPKGIYGESKLAAEKGLVALGESQFQICIVRPPMIYGLGCKGNYQILSKFAKKTLVFPDYENERSMLFINNFSPFLKRLIDDCSGGIYHPCNAENVCTSNMVKTVSSVHGRKIFTTHILNPIISRVNLSIIRKVFGSLVFDKTIAAVCDTYDFISSIEITEGKRVI